MFKRVALPLLLTLSLAGIAGAQERGAVAPIISGPNAKVCFEPAPNAGADACIQRTAPGVLQLTNGIANSGTPVAGGVTAAFVNPVTNGLLAQYNLLETGGTTIADASGNGNTGTFGCLGGGGNPTFTGTPAGGLNFSSSCVTLPAALNSAQTIVIFATHPTSASANTNLGTNPGECLVASNGNGATNTGASPICLSSITGYNTPVSVERFFTYVNGANSSSSIDIFSGSGTLGVVMGLTGNSTVDQLYENGVATVDTVNRGATGGTQTVGAYCLGGCGAGKGNTLASYFSGSMYMAVFYNRQLSPAEMAAVHGWMADTMNVRGVPVQLQDTAAGDLIFIDGDSISVAANAGVNWTSFMNPTGAAFSIIDDGFAGYGSCSLSQPQFSLNPMFRSGTNAATRQVAVVWIGANNIAGAVSCPPNTTASEVNQLASLCNVRRTVGWKCMPMTVLSHIGGGVDAIKNTWNTLLRQTWSTWADGLIDIAANPNLGADGAFANTTFFQVDGIHPTGFSFTTIVAPMVQHGINRLYGNTLTSGNPNTYRVGAAAVPQFVQAVSSSASCVQDQSPNLTGTCAFINNTKAGDAGVISWIWFNAVTISGCTDTQGNTWSSATAKFTLGAFPYNMQEWSTPNMVGGADTVTCTWSGAAVHAFPAVAEYSGVATVAPVDVASVGAQSSGSATETTAAATTTVAGDLLIGAFGNDANPSTTAYNGAGAGFQINTTNARVLLESQVAGAAGAYTASTTTGVSVGWGAQLLALKAGTIPATTSLLDVDVYANCDPGGGSITLNLPDAIGLTGQTVTIKNIQSAGANTCTIAAVNSETIDGGASVVVANKATLVLQSKLVSASAGGANWVQLQNN